MSVIKASLSLQSKGEGLLDGARKGSEPGLWRRFCSLPNQLTVSVGVKGKVHTFKLTLLLAYWVFKCFLLVKDSSIDQDKKFSFKFRNSKLD